MIPLRLMSNKMMPAIKIALRKNDYYIGFEPHRNDTFLANMIADANGPVTSAISKISYKSKLPTTTDCYEYYNIDNDVIVQPLIYNYNPDHYRYQTITEQLNGRSFNRLPKAVKLKLYDTLDKMGRDSYMSICRSLSLNAKQLTKVANYAYENNIIFRVLSTRNNTIKRLLFKTPPNKAGITTIIKAVKDAGAYRRTVNWLVKQMQ